VYAISNIIRVTDYIRKRVSDSDFSYEFIPTQNNDCQHSARGVVQNS